MSEQHMTPPVLSTTRSLAFVTHAQLVEAYDAFVRKVGTTPCIEVRGTVEFVEPGKRPGRFRKKREVELPDWYEVREWKRDEALLLIWYRLSGGIYRNYPRTVDQWIRPVRCFQQWYYVCLRRSFAEENAAYLAHLRREREEGRIW
jgi:hypothetical protein